MYISEEDAKTLSGKKQYNKQGHCRLLISRVCICGERFNSCPDVSSSFGMMGTKGDVEIMDSMIPFNLKNKKEGHSAPLIVPQIIMSYLKQKGLFSEYGKYKKRLST